MKQIVLIAALLLAGTSALMAQDVDIDKNTGMVQVDGKDAFYLTPKNKKMMISDYSLENLSHNELAYLKYTKYGSDYSYYMVFSKTGNQCYLTGFGTLGNTKHLIKVIAAAGLVKGDSVSEQEERKFIILNNGTFVKDPSTVPPPPAERVIVTTTTETKRNIPTADISIKEDKIYNNSELVGVFKKVNDGGNSVISVYNANDAMICKATHQDNNNNADWNLMIDGKAITLLYNSSTPLEKLFKYLAEKGYL